MSKAETRDVLSPDERSRVGWHISTFSDGGRPNCVEAGPLGDGSGRVAVRHSQHPDAELIVYTRAEWEAFVAGVRNGEFDFFG
ncbi:hypothetical protein BTM25_21600 [Actinomadura rubteroloni]|uniref:DUF397 domain-containing protein n=1 Tax=Actinomadura rubteroloni TaxID=1926885 RepID=A0A2P4URR4_9ACTN|nr:DUF397 domain-containing protein [Actinomadura rubteroloni]POM27741.1 hypothetical protein BTM25_21600 [Actinomadura rubteroloni]